MGTVPAAGSPVPPPHPRPCPAALREDAGLQSPPAPRADSVKEHVAEGPRVLAGTPPTSSPSAPRGPVSP